METKDKSYWFTHDCDATDDPKIIALMDKYDWAGYGRWWRICEALRKCEGYKYDIASKFAYPSLAKTLGLPVAACKTFITDCIEEFELLQTDGQSIWSDSFLARMEKWDKKKEVLSERGRKGAEVMHAKRAAQAHANESGTTDTLNVTEGENALKELRKSYSDLTKDKLNVYNFINNLKPTFIEPYVDMWNIFAAEYKKPKISAPTKNRLSHFNARIREKQFDFLKLLAKAKASSMCLEAGWFTFDFLIKNTDGYIKLLEGNYDNKQTPTPVASANNTDERLKNLLEQQ